jgi:pentatricopeptide repeat protein
MALEAFSEMCSNGGEPGESAFLGVLAACNHTGLVNEGVALFRAITAQHGAAPTPSHYACVVDMLGRSGRFDDALHLIEDMPFEPGILIWKTLLASCRLHGNLETGKLATEKLMELSEGGEDLDSAGYVLMSGIHAMRGEWRDADRVRQRMDKAGVSKTSLPSVGHLKWNCLGSVFALSTAQEDSRAGILQACLASIAKLKPYKSLKSSPPSLFDFLSFSQINQGALFSVAWFCELLPTFNG